MHILPLLLQSSHRTFKLCCEFLIAVHHVVHLVLLICFELVDFVRLLVLFELVSLIDVLDKAFFFVFGHLRVDILVRHHRRLVTGEFDLQAFKDDVMQPLPMLLHAVQVFHDLINGRILVLLVGCEDLLLRRRMVASLLIIVSIWLLRH